MLLLVFCCWLLFIFEDLLLLLLYNLSHTVLFVGIISFSPRQFLCPVSARDEEVGNKRSK